MPHVHPDLVPAGGVLAIILIIIVAILLIVIMAILLIVIMAILLIVIMAILLIVIMAILSIVTTTASGTGSGRHGVVAEAISHRQLPWEHVATRVKYGNMWQHVTT